MQQTGNWLDARINFSDEDRDGADEHVDKKCPNCPNDLTDWLLWIDNEYVRCLSCGTVYKP